MPRVISASRRTDIPAFYAEWFVNRLSAGCVYVRHPYTRKPFRVSLKPEDVHAFVFWSKNHAPILNKLETVERTTKNLFFHFTITANHALELRAPDYRDAIRDFIFLARRHSPERVIWRFDPICMTDKLSFEFFEDRFIRCANLLKGHAQKCFISFVHPYKKVLGNLQKYSKHALLELTSEEKQNYALRLAERAAACGIRLFACCNDYLVSETIGKASCIDGRYLSACFNTSIDTRPASSRKECACTGSTDIGAYDTCAHGCIYCYATADKNKAAETLQRHDPGWNSLIGQVNEAEADSVPKQSELNL
jgi:hypothetical protein